MKLPRFLARQPLRRQVVVLTILILVPLIAVMIWAATRVLAEREADLLDEAASVASTAQSAMNQYLGTVDLLAAVLTRHPAVQQLDEDEAHRLFQTVLENDPVILNVTTVDRNGVMRATGLPNTGFPPLLRPYARQVFETGKPAVGELMTGKFSGRPTVVMGYPVRDPAGRVVGALGIGLNLMALGRVFASIALPPNSVITLTDRDGHILARTLDPEKYVGRQVDTPGGPAEPHAVPRTQIQVGMDGVRRVFGSTVIERGPWVLSIGIPTTVAFARALPLWKRNITTAVLFVLLSFGASFLLVTWLTGPLGDLTAAARRIAEGDLSPPPPLTPLNREIADLHRAFQVMAENVRDARDTLDRQVDEERRMRSALQSLQRQVVRQERLAAVGVLVSGVAHELNNPLQAILGGAELLERSSGLSPDQRAEITLIKTQSARARDIIRNLSRFSSQQTGPAAAVDLRDVIDEVVQLRKRDLGRASIALDVEIATQRRVVANFTEVEQVLLNFVINAQHAIEAAARSSGRMTIRLIDAGKRVRVEVKDDGPGVAASDEPKLFQPFFTTKPVGKGTGLGLSVSYGIVESHGGVIGYGANEWGGATFFFELPAAAAGDIKSDDRAAVLHRRLSSGI